ncbi:MAG: DUF6335 family protein [Cyanobacteria bacterium P01_G01_bin.38]
MTHDTDQPPTDANNPPDDFELDDFELDDFESKDSGQSEDFMPSSAEVANLSTEELTDRDTGFGRILHQLRDESAVGQAPTGGDIDVNQYQAKVSGEEAVGGTAPTPDQNVVEDLAASEGIATPDEHPLRTLRMMQARDTRRWEMDPESSEDYKDHSL